MTLISCIVPMYNSSKTIIRALESIKSQTYKGKLQIIVVDDGSIDNSVTLVNDFKMQNSDLCIDLVLKSNGGVSSARNLGMEYAQGDYIAFLDSDDEWLEEKILLQLETITLNPEIDLLGSRVDGITLKKNLGRKVGLLIELSPFSYIIKTQMSTPTVFFKKEVYEKIGQFDETMKYSEDMNYWLRCMEHFKCYVLNVPLVTVERNNNMKNGGGLSNKLWAMEKGELKNIKYIYEKRHINYFQYLVATTFSLIKFIRRTILKKI